MKIMVVLHGFDVTMYVREVDLTGEKIVNEDGLIGKGVIRNDGCEIDADEYPYIIVSALDFMNDNKISADDVEWLFPTGYCSIYHFGIISSAKLTDYTISEWEELGKPTILKLSANTSKAKDKTGYKPLFVYEEITTEGGYLSRTIDEEEVEVFKKYGSDDVVENTKIMKQAPFIRKESLIKIKEQNEFVRENTIDTLTYLEEGLQALATGFSGMIPKGQSIALDGKFYKLDKHGKDSDIRTIGLKVSNEQLQKNEKLLYYTNLSSRPSLTFPIPHVKVGDDWYTIDIAEMCSMFKKEVGESFSLSI